MTTYKVTEWNGKGWEECTIVTSIKSEAYGARECTRTWERMLKEDGLQMQFKSDIKCSEISAYPPNHNFEEEEPIWTKTWY